MPFGAVEFSPVEVEEPECLERCGAMDSALRPSLEVLACPDQRVVGGGRVASQHERFGAASGPRHEEVGGARRQRHREIEVERLARQASTPEGALPGGVSICRCFEERLGPLESDRGTVRVRIPQRERFAEEHVP